MPDPIRTGLLLPPALLAGEAQQAEHQGAVGDGGPVPVQDETVVAPQSVVSVHARAGMPLKLDPFGRDGPRRQGEWSVEPLSNYLKDVARQVEANLRDGRLPTAERLEQFVSRLVAQSQRQLTHAPRKCKHALQAMFVRRFQKFWNFPKNEKVRTITPVELHRVIVGIVENLNSEFSESPWVLAQPKPIRYYSCGQLPPGATDIIAGVDNKLEVCGA